jgi:serine protease 16
MFTKGLATVKSQITDCVYTFNIPEKEIKANIDASNAYYGGLDPQGSRIMYINGEVDPWHAASIPTQDNSDYHGFPTHWCEGCSHHSWTHPCTEDTCQQSVMKTIEAEMEQLHAWVGEE